MTKVKPNLSMRIDPETKERYKQETYLQGVDMTEPIENFMLKYAEAGQRARSCQCVYFYSKSGVRRKTVECYNCKERNEKGKEER